MAELPWWGECGGVWARVSRSPRDDLNPGRSLFLERVPSSTLRVASNHRPNRPLYRSVWANTFSLSTLQGWQQPSAPPPSLSLTSIPPIHPSHSSINLIFESEFCPQCRLPAFQHPLLHQSLIRESVRWMIARMRIWTMAFLQVVSNPDIFLRIIV